jgi:hypothetical protein
MKKHLIALILACAPLMAHAAPQNKTLVYINCSSETGDNIGEQVCTALKDDIAASPRYTLLSSEPTAKGTFYFKIHFITLSDENGSSFQSVVLSGDTTDNSYYLTSWAFLTGGAKVKMQASTMAAKFDTAIADLLK